MLFGTAFHKFAELYASTKDLHAALSAAVTYFKSAEDVTIKKNKEFLDFGRLINVCNHWQSYHDSDSFVIAKAKDKPLTEVQFAIPFLKVDDIEFLLCGTIDKIGQFRNGCFAFGDYKTSSAWNQDEYFSGYQLDVQPLVYKWALRWHAQQQPNSIWSDIASKGKVGFFIEGIFLTKAKIFPEIERSPVMFISDDELDEWESVTKGRLTEFAHYIAASLLPPREGRTNGTCKFMYGPCKYFGPCASPDEQAFKQSSAVNSNKLHMTH